MFRILKRLTNVSDLKKIKHELAVPKCHFVKNGSFLANLVSAEPQGQAAMDCKLGLGILRRLGPISRPNARKAGNSPCAEVVRDPDFWPAKHFRTMLCMI